MKKNSLKYQKRIKKFKHNLNTFHLDSFLITEPLNLKYLSGFEIEGILLFTENENYIISDSCFEIELSVQKLFKVVISSDYIKSVCEIVKKYNLKALGFEDNIKYYLYDELDEKCSAAIISFADLVERQRAIKEENEIQKLKKAAQLAAQGYEFILANSLKQRSEKQIADLLDFFMKNHGAQKASFEPIIASGLNALAPHHLVSDQLVKDHELVLIDFGYFVEDYTFDVSRTFGIGLQNKKIYDLYLRVYEAQQKAFEIIKEGTPIFKLERTVRYYLKKYDLDQYFTHGLGHGIGLSVHEYPFLTANNEELLQTNEVITIEPGIYLSQIGGIRLEDDILVTKKGYQRLTSFSNKYFEV